MAKVEWVLLDTDDVVKTNALSENKPPRARGHPGWRWLKKTFVNPPHDPETQVKEGPVISVTATEYQTAYTVRQKTPAELQDAKDNEVSNVAAVHGSRVLYKGLLAVCQAVKSGDVTGLPATDAEMVAWLKGL